jgi:hypothetical protein
MPPSKTPLAGALDGWWFWTEPDRISNNTEAILVANLKSPIDEDQTPFGYELGHCLDAVAKYNDWKERCIILGIAYAQAKCDVGYLPVLRGLLLRIVRGVARQNNFLVIHIFHPLSAARNFLFLAGCCCILN